MALAAIKQHIEAEKHQQHHGVAAAAAPQLWHRGVIAKKRLGEGERRAGDKRVKWAKMA